MDTRTVTISRIYAPGWTVLVSGFDMIIGDVVAGDLFINVKAVLETKDGKESGAHSTIEPQKNSGVSLSLINGEANVLTTESRMDTKVEVNGGTKTTVGGNLNVTTDLTTVARTTGNDAGVNVAFATVAVQVLDPYVQNALDVIFGGNIKVNATTDSIAQVYVKNPTTAGAISTR